MNSSGEGAPRDVRLACRTLPVDLPAGDTIVRCFNEKGVRCNDRVQSAQDVWILLLRFHCLDYYRRSAVPGDKLRLIPSESIAQPASLCRKFEETPTEKKSSPPAVPPKEAF